MQCCAGSISEFVGSLDSPLGSVGVSDGPVAAVATQFTHKKRKLKTRHKVVQGPLVNPLDHWTVNQGLSECPTVQLLPWPRNSLTRNMN